MGSVVAVQRIGGDVAIDFVNTLGGLPEDPDDEYLFGYADLLIWARGSGVVGDRRAADLEELAAVGPERAGTAFARALELRSALDVALRAHVGGPPLGAEDDAVLREAHRAAVARAVLQRQGAAYRWSWEEA